jgi:hypothetical protein
VLLPLSYQVRGTNSSFCVVEFNVAKRLAHVSYIVTTYKGASGSVLLKIKRATIKLKTA